MKILSFDVESNGLHGPAFAVAGVVVEDGKLRSEFQARCPIRGDVDPWVVENVIPPMKDFANTHRSAKAMRTAFWQWFTTHKPEVDAVVLENPYPVEARFLIACQDDDLEARYWQHPFPVVDLGSVLWQDGARTKEDRRERITEAVGSHDNQLHNPRWDAWSTAMTALKYLQ